MILVTGGTGLVGSHLLKQLIKGEESIRAIYRDEKSLNKIKHFFDLFEVSWSDVLKKVEWIKSDLLNPAVLEDAFIGVEYVYHCAAMVSFNKRDKNQMLKVNIEGTSNVVNLSLDYNIKKLCYVSSTAAIGNTTNGDFITEKIDWQNDVALSKYSISKYFAEMEVWRGSEEGLDVVIVNPSIIIGGGDWNSSSSNLFLKVWNGLRFYTLGVNGFVYINDVVKSMTELMNSDIKNERYLVIAENLTFQTLFNYISEYLNKPYPLILVRKWMTSVICNVEAIKSFLFKSNPLVTKESADSAMRITKYSNQKIKKDLQFEFTPIKIAVKETADLFLKDNTDKFIRE
ncbi:MAG: NAD-dependent epimerase/dehydratase family protein [Flavobacteriales bacterium]|nr:NAD-dependent epimerase/dehydratase family protein [Flavobacteriales bacterium]